MTYYKGDTLRLKATFYTYAGDLSDLSSGSPTLKIYDDHEILIETVLPASVVHDTTGVYYYDYTTDRSGKHTYEYSGTLEGKTVLGRGTFNVVFV
jgi:hypothetical protein